jgi:DNA (cytosine-5)-methyltransferase 1
MIAANELIIDNFAGGGGASTGIFQATGRHVDIAINHDREALALHAANHPETLHLCEDVWAVDPVAVCAGRPVGLAWFSPDCKHFSKAKGGKPVSKKIRGLAWVALRWAGLVKPRVIVVENVEEFQGWGPIVDGRPCPRRKGMTFKKWVAQLRNLGYLVDWRELRACDYGAPTIRKRLFVVARCDGQPIIWPQRTHGTGMAPFQSAAECIDWSLPCHSIFLSRKDGRAVGVNRPLAEKTMRRIAKGIERYVFGSAKPFIVTLTHAGGERVTDISEPLRTQPTENRFALVSTFLQRQFGKSVGSGSTDPIGSVTAGGGGKTAVVSAFLAQHNSERSGVKAGRPLSQPISTITGTGTQQQLVVSHVMKMRGTNIGSAADEPIHTISAGGFHHAEVRSFLAQYAPESGDEPTIEIAGERYCIVDIGMRMLTPRELFLAQGFPTDYIIDGGRDVCNEQASLVGGEWIELSKTAQVRMCGNSVSPYPAAALVAAQLGMAQERRAA